MRDQTDASIVDQYVEMSPLCANCFDTGSNRGGVREINEEILQKEAIPQPTSMFSFPVSFFNVLHAVIARSCERQPTINNTTKRNRS